MAHWRNRQHFSICEKWAFWSYNHKWSQCFPGEHRYEMHWNEHCYCRYSWTGRMSLLSTIALAPTTLISLMLKMCLISIFRSSKNCVVVIWIPHVSIFTEYTLLHGSFLRHHIAFAATSVLLCSRSPALHLPRQLLLDPQYILNMGSMKNRYWAKNRKFNNTEYIEFQL